MPFLNIVPFFKKVPFLQKSFLESHAEKSMCASGFDMWETLREQRSSLQLHHVRTTPKWHTCWYHVHSPFISRLPHHRDSSCNLPEMQSHWRETGCLGLTRSTTEWAKSCTNLLSASLSQRATAVARICLYLLHIGLAIRRKCPTRRCWQPSIWGGGRQRSSLSKVRGRGE